MTREKTVTRGEFIQWLIAVKLGLGQSFCKQSGPATPFDLSANLVEGWRLEEASGSRAAILDTPTRDLADNATVTQGVGQFGNAAQFVRVNSEWLDASSWDGLDFSGLDYAGGGGYGVMAWIKMDTQVNSIIACRNNGVTKMEWQLTPNSGAFRFQCSGDGLFTVTAEFEVMPGSIWVHLAGWRKGRKAYLRIKTASDEYSAESPELADDSQFYDAATDLQVGRNAGGFHFNGLIDELGIWNVPLTAAMMNTHYNNGLAGI